MTRRQLDPIAMFAGLLELAIIAVIVLAALSWVIAHFPLLAAAWVALVLLLILWHAGAGRRRRL